MFHLQTIWKRKYIFQQVFPENQNKCGIDCFSRVKMKVAQKSTRCKKLGNCQEKWSLKKERKKLLSCSLDSRNSSLLIIVAQSKLGLLKTFFFIFFPVLFNAERLEEENFFNGIKHIQNTRSFFLNVPSFRSNKINFYLFIISAFWTVSEFLLVLVSSEFSGLKTIQYDNVFP